jgi:tetratricopeptide (TPR) repeat protein
VDAAHRKLIIHRDLKPGNILVTPEGEPKLLDFGTSKLIESRGTDGKAAAANKSKLTELGFRAFTPEFASPEQVLGGAVSTASDVYSLGVILYRMVSGTHPYKFESQSSTEYVRVLRDVEPLAPSAASNRKELRGDLDAIVLKAMHKDPEHRYGAAADLAADLRAWLDGRPVSAQEPTLAYRASKFVRRHRGAIAAASVVAVFLATATILTAMAAREARREETRANRQFRNIRDLNRAILFDFFDAVQKLPGSMDVQKQIVNQSLDYITRMQRESPNDSESAYDLIEAYQRLGNVYANPYSDNLSNPKEGVQAMQRGLDIAYGLMKRNPSDDRARRLVASTEECLGEVLLGAGDADGAAEHMRKAIAAFEELASRADVTADLLAEASAAHGALSDVMVGIYGGRRDEAIVESELRRAIELEYKALERDPKHIRARRGVAVSFFKLGRLVIETKPAEAVTAFESAIQEIRRLPSEVQSSVDILRLIALMEWRTSGAWTLLGDYAKGLEHAHASRRISESLERLDPENARSQMDLAGALYIVANTHDYRAFATGSADDRREALRYYASHLLLLRKLITGNPKNQMLYAQLCESQLRVAQLQFKQGLNAQAVEALRESRKLAGELARSKDAEPAAIHRAAIVFGSSYLPESEWNLAEARQFAERLNEKTGYQRPEYLHTLGSIYNRLAMKPQALEIYKKAVALLPEDKPGTPRTVLSNEIREELAALTSNTAPSRPGK